MLLEDYLDCVDMVLAGVPTRDEWVQEAQAATNWSSWARYL